MITAVKRRFFPVEPVLPAYRQPKNALWTRLRNVILVSLLVFVGLLYGGIVAIFPLFFYIWLALPLGMLVILVIWTLPEARSFPAAGIERMFFAFLLIMFLWPNYLAVSIPGLPWITMNRLITFPLSITFLISLSISRALRTELGKVLGANKWLSIAFCVYLFTQTYSIVLADQIGDAINKYIDAQTQWTAAFFIGAWVFLRDGRAERFLKLLLLCGVLILISALVEWRMGHVPWHDYIPSFLAVPDPSVERSLAGQVRSAVGIYRVQGTFSTSLNLAEFLAFTFSAAFYWAFNTRSLIQRVASIAYMIVAFGVIIITDSRTGPVCVFASLFVYGLVWTLRRWRQEREDFLAPLVIVMFPIVAAGFVALSLTWIRLRNMTWGGAQHQASTATRLQQWDNFWPALGKWPLGYGIGQGAIKAGTYNGEGVFTLDSYYIVTFLDYGVIGGLGFYGALLIGSGSALYYGARGRGKDANILLSIGTMLVAFLVSKAVLIQDDSHGAIFMALGMAAALCYREKQKRAAEEQSLQGTAALFAPPAPTS